MRRRMNCRTDTGENQSMESFIQDVRYGLRALAKKSRFTIAAAVTMRWDSSAVNMILANNAICSSNKNALNLSGSVGTFFR